MNRANGVVVFQGSPIRYNREGSPIRYNRELLYRIGLSSNTATLLALFGGSVRIEELFSYEKSYRPEELLYLKMTRFPPN